MEAKRSRFGGFNASEPSAGRSKSSDFGGSKSSTGRPDRRRPSAGRRVCTKRSLVAVFGFSLCILVAPILDRKSHGFWAQGHHAIAVLAFEMLEPAEQNELIELLKHHPRFQQDFTIPDSIQGDERAIHRWWIGVAGEWPDLIRGNEKYDRPTWHYQLGASVVLGDVEVPEDPGPLPDDATMETRELYIVQAIELCKKVLHEESQPKADRALAICWLAHLVADAHQPCHAGSLYSPKAFPNGDRGANLIPIKGQGDIRNLHAFWDSLLGAEATPESVEKRVANLRAVDGNRVIENLIDSRSEIENDTRLLGSLEGLEFNRSALASVSCLRWISTSREIAQLFVYGELLGGGVMAVERGFTGVVASSSLTERYQNRAELAARILARAASFRLQSMFVGS